MSQKLKIVAQQTLAILDRGSYVTPSGQTVSLGDAVERAVAGTRTYPPAELVALLERTAAEPSLTPQPGAPTVEVTEETTAAGARRLLAEGAGRVVALNFASAKNAGGGFINGAKAQEEDLARASALYPCLRGQREYYDRNRADGTMLYTDHVIYSPGVPFFRADDGQLLAEPVLISIITAPAPNAGEHLRRHPGEAAGLTTALRRRAGMVLAIAEAEGHRDVVLGAWGCGVFRNDPAEVADAFGRWLDSPRFAGAFDRVLFPVYARQDPSPTREAFRLRLR